MSGLEGFRSAPKEKPARKKPNLRAEPVVLKKKEAAPVIQDVPKEAEPVQEDWERQALRARFEKKEDHIPLEEAISKVMPQTVKYEPPHFGWEDHDEAAAIAQQFASPSLAVDPERKPEPKLSAFERFQRWGATADLKKWFFGEKERPMSARAENVLLATSDLSRNDEVEAERMGVGKYFRKFSEKMLKPLTFKERLVLTAVVMTAGVALGATAAVPLILRGVASLSLASMAKSGAQKKLENRGVSKEKAEKLALAAGALAFSAAFVGGHYASQYFGAWLQMVWDTEPSSIAVAPEVPSAPVESSFIHSVSNESANAISAAEPPAEAPMQYELLNPDAADSPPISESVVQPDMSDAADSVAHVSEPPTPIEISGDMSVWGSFTDGLNERLADQGLKLTTRSQEALAHAIQRAVEETGTQGEFLEHGGRALSDVAWDKIPDGTMVHFDKLFENDEFMHKLEDLLKSGQYKSLSGKIGDVSGFLDKLAAAHGAR